MVGSSPNSFTPGARTMSSRAIGKRHAGAIDGLVAEPGAVKLVGIEIDDGFVDGRVEHLEVHFEAEVGGEVEAFDVVADEEAAHGETALRVAANDRVHVDDGDVFKKLVGSVVQDLAHRIAGASHDALHAVDRAEIVAAVDALASAGSDQDVLVVVGHADHFMRHDLSDGEHEIEATTRR